MGPPVLVVDDVQQLLKPPTFANGGQTILEWCLGRAVNQELTVLFILSKMVESSIKMSGEVAFACEDAQPMTVTAAAAAATKATIGDGEVGDSWWRGWENGEPNARMIDRVC